MKKFILLHLSLFFSLIINAQTLEGKKVLWLGTSIPAGCTYPRNACANLGMECQNNAMGASFLAESTFTEKSTYTGYSLSMSIAEKDSAYKHFVEDGIIDKHQLDVWKFTSYENRMIPFLKDVDIVIIDHGYNDHFTIKNEYNLDESEIDWSSENKKTFIGAFNFIYRKIKEHNPNAIIAIGGYFQNTCTFSYTIAGLRLSKVLTMIANHYDLPLLDTWNYTGMKDGHIPNSKNYFKELNEQYGTSFYNQFPDENGNITYFQKFCPDAVHPFSDPTGESDKILDEIFTKLLKERLTPLFSNISEIETTNDATILNIYTTTGLITDKPQKGINIFRMSDGSVKKILIK